MMTLEEMGRRLKTSPQALEHYTREELDRVDDSALALAVLKRHPEYWDLVSPVARRLNDLSKGEFSRGRWYDFMLGTGSLNLNDRDTHATVRSEADALNHVHLTGIAGSEGVDVPTLMELRKAAGAARAQLDVIREHSRAARDLEIARAEAQVMVIDAQTRQQNDVKQKDLDIHLQTLQANVDFVLKNAEAELRIRDMEAARAEAAPAGRDLGGADAQDAREAEAAGAEHGGVVPEDAGELGDLKSAG